MNETRIGHSPLQFANISQQYPINWTDKSGINATFYFSSEADTTNENKTRELLFPIRFVPSNECSVEQNGVANQHDDLGVIAVHGYA